MFLLTFRFEDDPDVSVSAEPGENLFRIARRAGIAINAPCSGGGSCGKCRIRLIAGTLDSPETFYISDPEYREGWRLACLSRVAGDAIVYIPD